MASYGNVPRLSYSQSSPRERADLRNDVSGVRRASSPYNRTLNSTSNTTMSPRDRSTGNLIGGASVLGSGNAGQQRRAPLADEDPRYSTSWGANRRRANPGPQQPGYQDPLQRGGDRQEAGNGMFRGNQWSYDDYAALDSQRLAASSTATSSSASSSSSDASTDSTGSTYISSDSSTSGSSDSGDGERSTNLDLDDEPLVPVELLCSVVSKPYPWIRHPSCSMVMSLLQARGISPPRFHDVIEYHMAEAFLDYLDLCRKGAYFLEYSKKRKPRERFFAFRMFPFDREMSPNAPSVPCIVSTLHQGGVQVLDVAPLSQLVGITTSIRSVDFRPHLLHRNVICGVKDSTGHRTRLPTNGAFTLWFYDQGLQYARSLSLLTCNETTFTLWTQTAKGVVSVNSTSPVSVPLTKKGQSMEMERMRRAAQSQLSGAAAAETPSAAPNLAQASPVGANPSQSASSVFAAPPPSTLSGYARVDGSLSSRPADAIRR